MKRIFVSIIFAVGLVIAIAPVPRYRIERIFFGTLLPPIQTIMGLSGGLSGNHGFAFENPQALQPLRDRYALDQVVMPARTDFDAHVLLMHWVRDQFPHATPKRAPRPQAFDGVAVLQAVTNGEETGFLCGTASQLLIQAISSLGGYARRVELRATPRDAHAVVEAWSQHYNKWVILDPDYDIYYTANGVPLHAIELHDYWAKGDTDTPTVHSRASAHNIFINKKLSHYQFISYPLRNDWISRPLAWWHPDGNHVQNSLVIQLPSMPRYEDFVHRLDTPDLFYQSPGFPLLHR